ncbi:MAG TPA: hypothetical protein VFR71_04685 [Methyloceanibacter sp.]|jgi:hypothetical protein|nr:hypothetical protein [Methyloceanibacter sp.]
MSSDPKSPGALFDAHCAAEFETRDIDATTATMSDHPHITNVPTMTGGYGREAVRQFTTLGLSGICRRIGASNCCRAPRARIN